MYYRVSGRGGSRARPSGAILMGEVPHGNQKGRRGGTGLFQPGTTRATALVSGIGGADWSVLSCSSSAIPRHGGADGFGSARSAILSKSTVRCGFDRPLADAEVAGDLTVRSR